MHSVLIAVNNPHQSKFKRILTSSGYQVIATVNDAYSALRFLQNRKGALSLIDTDLHGINGLQLAKIIADENLGPVVLVSKHAIDTETNIPKCIFGVLVQPITQYQLLNTVSLAITQYNHQKQLEKEVAKLKGTIESRKIIERAKGILMRKQGLSEDEAYQKLRKISMERRIAMKELAEAIINEENFLL
jgi:response regulator NasT